MSEESPEELPPDFEFGAYVIRECIGRGGMARIYRAEHGALRRSVALKVLDRWLLEQPTGRERFLREARAAAAIKHPHVVDILDVGVWCERPFIVMELLNGCDLDTYLDEYGTLSNREIASLALPVIAGVMAVHDAGVVHRDLKPSNIFLSKGPEGLIVPKVLDFGVSKVSNTLKDSRPCDTESREIIGTPAYMAPEGLEGVRMLGPTGDQYSLGAVLYECAVGRPPFEGETLLGLLKALAVGDVERPRVRRPDILPELEQVILRAIARDPNDRFPSLREMGRELWPFADERTKTVWEHCFGNGKAGGEGTPPWMGFRMQPREKSRRRAGWRRGARAVKEMMGQRWAAPIAVALASGLLLAGGLLLNSDPPEPVATTLGGAPATGVRSAEPSLPARSPAPAEPSASHPDARREAEQATQPAPLAQQRGVARPSEQLTTATAVLHGANAESDERAARSAQAAPSRRSALAAQVAQHIAPVRRKPARRNAARELASARSQLAAMAARPVNSERASDSLDDPFAVPAGSRAEVSSEGELDGMFPGATGAIEHGANQAPIPD